MVPRLLILFNLVPELESKRTRNWGKFLPKLACELMGISWYTEPYLTRTRIVGAGTEVLSESVRFWTSIPPGRISQSIGLESAFVGGAGGGLVLVLSIFPPSTPVPSSGFFFFLFRIYKLNREMSDLRRRPDLWRRGCKTLFGYTLIPALHRKGGGKEQKNWFFFQLCFFRRRRQTERERDLRFSGKIKGGICGIFPRKWWENECEREGTRNFSALLSFFVGVVGYGVLERERERGERERGNNFQSEWAANIAVLQLAI